MIFIEHPYWSYLGVSMVYGVYAAIRWTPKNLRIIGNNHMRLADSMDELLSTSPPGLFEITKLLCGFFWPYLILKSVFYRVNTVFFGPREEHFD